MDVNGDGRIQTGSNSPEYTFAKDESVIYHVNGRDVSIAAVDLVRKTFSVRDYAPGANRRIALSKGSVVPNFTFWDLQGNQRQFADFRGRYVLLDFWGSWCGPCARLLPELQQVHQSFEERGLVLLGLPSHEQDSKAIRVTLEAHGATFLQAEPDTVKDLVEKQFRVNAFPTHVLTDPEGRIVETGQALRPPELSRFLDQLLPSTK
jgi:thiol-disulfide isomerase/thioredoxin